MPVGTMVRQRGASFGHGRPLRTSYPAETMPASSWLPAVLGTAAIMAGLGLRRKGTVALALTAFAGVAAIGALRGGTPGRERADGEGALAASEPEMERSITIGKTADELRQRWLDPGTLPQIMAAFATVQAIGDGRTHWTLSGPLGRHYEWEAETIDDRAGDRVGWCSLPHAAIPNEGWIRFRPAPADRGTVMSLRLRFDPPGGALGDAAIALFGTTSVGLAADWALHRFKSLVETGEIPTTERQPAARADTR